MDHAPKLYGLCVAQLVSLMTRGWMWPPSLWGAVSHDGEIRQSPTGYFKQSSQRTEEPF